MMNVDKIDEVKSKAVIARSLQSWVLLNRPPYAACDPINRSEEQLKALLKTACELQSEMAEKPKSERLDDLIQLVNLQLGKACPGAAGMTLANELLDTAKEEDRIALLKKVLDHDQLQEKTQLEPLLGKLIRNGYLPASIAKEIDKAKEGYGSKIGSVEGLERELTLLKKPSVPISGERIAFKDNNGKLFVASKDYLKLNKEMEEASKANKLTPELKAKVFGNLQEVNPKTGALTTYTPEKMVADYQAARAAEQAKLDAEPVKPGEEKYTNWSGTKIQRGQKLRDSWNVEKIVRDPKMGKDALLVQFKHPQFAEGAVYSWTAGPEAGWVFWRRQNPDQVCRARPGQHFICPVQVARR